MHAQDRKTNGEQIDLCVNRDLRENRRVGKKEKQRQRHRVNET